MQMIVSIPAGLLAIYVVERQGLKFTFVTSGVICVIACVMRLIRFVRVVFL